MSGDPGPMARFAELAADASTMGVLVQRLTDGETLKEIAKAWQVPYGKLCEWIAEDRGRAEKYSQALRFAAESFAHEVVPLADGATVEDVAVRKLQIEARKWTAGKWDRPKYGEVAAHVAVQVDNRVVLPDREGMLLEVARGMAFFLQSAGEIVEKREGQLLLAAPEKEKEAPSATVDDGAI